MLNMLLEGLILILDTLGYILYYVLFSIVEFRDEGLISCYGSVGIIKSVKPACL